MARSYFRKVKNSFSKIVKNIKNSTYFKEQSIVSATIVIPARYASVRLPGKPLLKETGKYLVEHVYYGAQQSRLAQEVLVATDDFKIYNAVREFGGKVEMTSDKHQSGTDRMAEVASRIPGDIFVNVQGDEPEITGQVIDQVVALLSDHPEASVATLVYPIDSVNAANPNIVKVVCNSHGFALYFSRAQIPYVRDSHGPPIEYLGHIGIYAYRRDFLLHYPTLKPSFLEKCEKLEQLRVLENGYSILTAVSDYRSRGIDTAEDYREFVTRYRNSQAKSNS